MCHENAHVTIFVCSVESGCVGALISLSAAIENVFHTKNECIHLYNCNYIQQILSMQFILHVIIGFNCVNKRIQNVELNLSVQCDMS